MDNDKITLARRIIERTDQSLFLTGRAGTGKTTFLRRLIETSRKRMVVTAPTGIAAINAGGVTLHSFFQLDFSPFVPGVTRPVTGRYDRFSRDKLRIIRAMDVLVIDEISMVRSDLLDAVDDVLRRYRDRNRPFGGVQLLMIGDLRQLPPVVKDSEKALLSRHYKSPYFFDSHSLSELQYATIELNHVYRQDEGEFLDILNAIRDGHTNSSVLSRLNSRYRQQFSPADDEGYIRLTTHNRLADNINTCRLEELPGEEFVYTAQIEGNFPESSYPVAQELHLKKGAQVMFIKNDTGMERSFYNGMIGHITDLGTSFVKVYPIDGAEEIDVPLCSWENIKYTVDEVKNEIVEKREGVFRQLPLKPAWAITIHKSQGLTFDRAIIDAAASFTFGQTYVALSRCRTMEGLVLERPLSASAIITDATVSNFMQLHTADTLTEDNISGLENAYKLHLAQELFDFRILQGILEGVQRIIKENFFRHDPLVVRIADEAASETKKNITEVGIRFCRSLGAMHAEGDGNITPLMIKRISEGASYFAAQLKQLRENLSALPDNHTNKRVATKLNERLEMLADALKLKTMLMHIFSRQDFSTADYLEAKGNATLSAVHRPKPDIPRPENKKPKKKAPAATNSSPSPKLPPAPIEESSPVPVEETPAAPEIKIKKSRKSPKPAKEPAIPSGMVSIEMLRHGKSLNQICEERNLKRATILSHLLRFGETQDFPALRKIVPPTEAAMIQLYIDTHPGELPSNTEIMTELPVDMDYDWLRIIRKINGR